MKTVCLLLLTMSWMALRLGTACAGSSDQASPPTPPASSAATAGAHPGGQNSSDLRRDHGRAPITSHPPGRAGLTQANRPKQIVNNRQRSLHGNALQPTGADKFRGAAGGGLTRNQTVHASGPVRVSSTARPMAPQPDNLSHQRRNSVELSGTQWSHRNNTAAINGTHMNRKP